MALREYLTKPQLSQPTLAERMAVTKEGQVTWVDLLRFERCHQCRYFGKTKGEKGRCALVKAHTRKQGKEFIRQARVCSKYEARHDS
jgi:hypothetical protein